MQEKPKTKIDVCVYHHLEDDTWRVTHYEKDAKTCKKIREISEPLIEELILTACKAFAKKGALEAPHLIETPAGLFKNIGSGYGFLTGTRDVQFQLLPQEEADNILYGPKPSIWWRFKHNLSFRWSVLKHKFRKWRGKEDAPLPPPCCDIPIPAPAESATHP